MDDLFGIIDLKRLTETHADRKMDEQVACDPSDWMVEWSGIAIHGGIMPAQSSTMKENEGNTDVWHQVSVMLQKVATVLVFIFPAFLVMVPDGKYVAVVLLLVSLVGLLLARERVPLLNHEQVFLYVFLFYFLVQLFNVWWFSAELRELDTSSRFLIVLPIFFYLRKVGVEVKWLIKGVVLAAIVIGFSALYDVFVLQTGRPTSQTDIGTYALFSAVYSLMSLAAVQYYRENRVMLYLSILAFLGGLSGVVLALTRGVWIAFVIAMLSFVLINPFQWKKGSMRTFLLLMMLLVAIIYLVPETGVAVRVDQAIQNGLAYFGEGVTNSSGGARLEMWKAAMEVIANNPIFGVGENNFNQQLSLLIENKKIDGFVGQFNHPHNEYLSNLVEQGVVGLAALLLLFLAPLKVYYTHLTEGTEEMRYLMLSGFFIIVLYMGFSLTSGVFDHQIGALFYTIMFSIIMGIYSSHSRSVS